MSTYRFSGLQDLAEQLVRGPIRVRRREVRRLEELLAGFDPHRAYPYEFLHFRITGFRPREDSRDVYPGAEVVADLLLLLSQLSRSAPRPVEEEEEPVHTADGLSARFGVSERTVRRWRRRGLPASAYRFPDGRVRMATRQSLLEAFAQAHGSLLERSRRFRRLMPAEEDRILRMARHYARRGALTLTAAAGRIARRLARAPETVRLFLVRHDRERPDEAFFAPAAGSLGARLRRRVWQDYRRGTPADELCSRYNRSRASIYRILNRERAIEILDMDLPCIQDEAFTRADADEQILGAELRELLDRLREELGAPAGAQPPAVRAAQERQLFLALNFARFRMRQLRTDLHPKRYVPAALLDRIDGQRALAEQVRETLVRAHLPLADRLARQHAGRGDDVEALRVTARARLAQLVDAYDWRRRGRFTAFAQLQLLKRFARAQGST